MSMTIDQCWRLSATWYAGRLDLDHVPQTTAERQAQLAAVGLVGPDWELP
jgi:hypothetical protein